MTRVAITGVGVVTPIGVGAHAFWDGLLAGRCGVRAITLFDASAFPTRIAGEIDFDALRYLDRRRVKHMDRTSTLGVTAARLAREDAALDIASEDIDRIGVMVGTSRGQYDFDYVASRRFSDGSGTDLWKKTTPESTLRAFPEACASQICVELGIHGPSLTITSAGSTGLDSIGYAFNAIRTGELDVVLAGGAQAPLGPALINAFNLLGTMSRLNDDPAHAVRPFDVARSGFVLGEGAGVFVLESLAHAAARGARVYAEVVGYASTSDADAAPGPHPDGADAARAMRLAMDDAGVSAEIIDYVAATGLGQRTADIAESRAITAVGVHAPVSSIEGATGNLFGAAGAVETAAAVLAMHHGMIPHTLNLDTPDAACALDHVMGAPRPARLRTVLKHSFGFAGKNAALVLQRA